MPRYKLLDFFKDQHGKIIIIQFPNIPLVGWFIFMLLDSFWYATHPKLHYFFSLVSFGFIFTWAWLEITQGVNLFRRTLGSIVIILAVWLHLY